MQLLHYYLFFYAMCTACLAFLQKSQLTQFTSDNRIVRLNLQNCSIDVYSREAQVDYFSIEYPIALRENCGKGNDVKFSVSGSCALVCFVKQDCQRYNIKNDGYPCTMDIFLSVSNSSTLIETNGNKVLLAGHITKFNQILIIDFTTGNIVSKTVADSLTPLSVHFDEDNVLVLYFDKHEHGSKDNLVLWCLDSNLNTNMRFTVDTNSRETIITALTKDNFLFIHFEKTLVLFHIDLDKRRIEKKLNEQLSSSAVILHADEKSVFLKQFNELRILSVEKNCVVGRMELTKDTDCLELLFLKNQSELLALSSDRRWKVTPLNNTNNECIPASQLIFSQWRNVTSEDYSCLIRTNYETFESEISKCTPLKTISEKPDLETTTTALPEFLFGTWSSWSEWTRCDCITRINKRRRFCMGASCEGCDWELSSCHSKCATVKRWQGWSEWHPINETKMLRTRSWCSSSTPCDSGIIHEHRQTPRIQHVSSKGKAPMTTSWTPWSHHDGTWVRARLLPNGSLEVSAYPARVFCVNRLPMWCMICSAFLGASAYACLAALSSLRVRQHRAPSSDWM